MIELAKIGLRWLKMARDVLKLAEVRSRRLRCPRGACKCGEDVPKMAKLASNRLKCAEMQHFQKLKTECKKQHNIVL
jgi:hypothetical protein